jgi:hypothetical protein
MSELCQDFTMFFYEPFLISKKGRFEKSNHVFDGDRRAKSNTG